MQLIRGDCHQEYVLITEERTLRLPDTCWSTHCRDLVEDLLLQAEVYTILELSAFGGTFIYK